MRVGGAEDERRTTPRVGPQDGRGARTTRVPRCVRAVSVVLVAGAALLAGGCATTDRRPEFRAFANGDYAAARAGYEARLAENPSEEALERNFAGTAALLQGDVRGAHRHFREAFDDLEDLTATTGETVGAIAGPESTKRWKGDSWERAMNAYYLGITYWLLGDPDNAAASFKAGLLRDADSRAGEGREGTAEGADADGRRDFAALWYLLGMAQREARHSDGGAAALARAEGLVPALSASAASRANLLVVLDVGFAPQKVASGAHGSEVRFRQRTWQTANAAVTADGTVIGRTLRATRLIDQAVDRGGGTMDAVNQTKAVVKDAAVVTGAVVLDRADNRNEALVGAGLIVAGLLLRADADVRQWDTLPGEIQVLPATLAPGRHVVRVEPQDASGRGIPDTAREFDVTITEGRTTFLWCRAAPRPDAAASVAAPDSPSGAPGRSDAPHPPLPDPVPSPAVPSGGSR